MSIEFDLRNRSEVDQVLLVVGEGLVGLPIQSPERSGVIQGYYRMVTTDCDTGLATKTEVETRTGGEGTKISYRPYDQHGLGGSSEWGVNRAMH